MLRQHLDFFLMGIQMVLIFIAWKNLYFILEECLLVLMKFYEENYNKPKKYHNLKAVKLEKIFTIRTLKAPVSTASLVQQGCSH